MSMLAERRTKKKWCLNPNGKDWSNDDNKFGQRMLEKMGWKKGCGLGVNLQGMKEHVRVLAKNDTKGLGCKNNSDTEWIHHQQNFENLLSELASSTFEEIRPPGISETKSVSLEEKSKKSRVRVHYQKFTRGKDVTRYSANDLACIFGKKCSSQDSKSFEMQYPSRIDTRNGSKADSEGEMISDEEHTVEQSLNLFEEKPTDDCLPSLLPKHGVKDQSMHYNTGDKSVQEKQNDILKEISNVKENSVANKDIAEECKSEMEDNTASHSQSESLGKTRNNRKRKHIKDSENNQEVFTETMILSPQDEVKECDAVTHEVEEEEEEKKKRKKKKKDKKNKAKVEDENGKEDDKILIEEHIEVVSEAEEIGNRVFENASVISGADTKGSKIKMKKLGKLHHTNISEACKESPEKKKRKKKKMCSQALNEPDVIGDIMSETVSPLPPNDNAGVITVERSINFTSEPFSSYKEQSHQHDSNNPVKDRKAVKKLCRKGMELGFRGSNLDSISGYGSFRKNMEFGFRGSNLDSIARYGSL